MKNSIKTKLFFAITGLTVFYVILSWFLNGQFLEDYYYLNKKKSLIESYKRIEAIYEKSENSQQLSEESLLELERLKHTKGLIIIIFNKNFDIVYDSLPQQMYFSPGKYFNRAKKPYGSFINEYFLRTRMDDIEKRGFAIEDAREYRLNADFLILYATLSNGSYLLLGTAAEPIVESVNIANRFLIITGIITIIIGSIIVLFLSKKFTKSIFELNKITQKMTKLDFSQKYKSKSNDEIGELGRNINFLSDQLEKHIKELEEANKKLQADIERERKIDEMRKEFISNVSHELKTPIALIQGYAEGLKVNVNQDEENKNYYCDVIIDEAYKMNRLIMQFLDLSQIESGYIHMEREDFDITALIEEVLKKNTLIFEEKNISVSFEYKERFIVNADMYMTEQVLMNYITNAINHVDDNKVIKVIVERKNEKVVVYVYNSGQHIPESELENIWISFYKTDKARTRSYGGTGLGLSVVKAIQKAHGNGYGVDNVDGGVRFWAEFDYKKIQS